MEDKKHFNYQQKFVGSAKRRLYIIIVSIADIRI